MGQGAGDTKRKKEGHSQECERSCLVNKFFPVVKLGFPGKMGLLLIALFLVQVL